MAELDLVRVDVFTEVPFAGNPANVVFGADALDEMQMQVLASEAWAPVTAFVMRSKRAEVRLRCFSPAGEEPLSGHGVIGALWCLADGGAFGGAGTGKHRVETAVGVLSFSVEPFTGAKHIVWITQKRPMFAREGDVKEVASALGIGADSLFQEEFPMCRASTGMPCLLVAVKSMDVISRLEPRREELTELCKELDVGAVGVFTWHVLDQRSTAHMRCFQPHPMPLEEPASSLLAGALGAYIAENEFVPREKLANIVVEQGHWLGRPSKVFVRIDKRAGSIRKVEAGGSAAIVMRARVEVP